MTGALHRLCEAHAGQSGVQLLDDGPAALAVRMLLVRAARISIDVQYYIWRDDIAGRLLLDELLAAAARGVQVRLLLDDFGSPGFDRLHLPGIAVRLFNPARLRWPRWLNWLFDLPRLNRRMHNKSLTVDGIATVIGGRNIGDEYFDASHPALSADLDVLAIGAIAQDVAADFQRYWGYAAAVPREQLAPRPHQPLLPAPSHPVRSVYLAAAQSPATRAMVDEAGDFDWVQVRMLSDPPAKIRDGAAEDTLILPRLLQALGPIRQRLLLVSAYFVPTDAAALLLGELAEQGVRVEVLTNSQLSNNVALVHAWYAPWRRPLLAAGVRLWEMRGRSDDRVTLGLVPQVLRRRLRRRPDATSFFRSSASALHAKTFIADSRFLFVGSMNFDARSLRLNTEMGFLIDAPALASRLQAALDTGLPRFAWSVEQHDGALAWREDGMLIQPEPGTSALQRALFTALGWLPLGHFF
jgi:cardiolipin synthase C